MKKGAKHSPESIEANRLAHLGRPAWNKGKPWSEEVKEKFRKAKLGKPSYERTPEIKEKNKVASTGRSPSQETREKLRQINLGKKSKAIWTEAMREKMRRKALTQHFHSQNTKIEKIMEAELLRRNVYFKKQTPLADSRVDFFLPEKNLVIECDGCFWHGCPIHRPNKDRLERTLNKTRSLEWKGFKVFRFWEHDINRSASECLDRIFKT